MALGAADGSSLSCSSFPKPIVGSLAGIAVGLRDGTEVGKVVGTWVGTAVGSIDGAAVGISVSLPLICIRRCRPASVLRRWMSIAAAASPSTQPYAGEYGVGRGTSL
eukprot:scaffold2516_cov242-Pinguiococcus_pyrenoidosus.AAC.1